MAFIRVKAAGKQVVAFVAVPWTAFVGLFLYAVMLTLVAIGVDQVSDGFMAVAYGAPVAVYAVVLLARAVHGLAALPMHFDAVPGHAVVRPAAGH